MSRHYSLYSVGFPDYSIDRHGNVYSSKKHYKGLKLKPRVRNGYMAVTLRGNGEVKSFNIHRLMAITFLKTKLNPSQLHVNHKDGDKKNNSIENLEWSNPSHNAKHREMLQLQVRRVGQDAYNAKFADKEIRVIKKLYKDYKWKQCDIASIFECSQGHVSQIINGKKRAKAILELNEANE